MINLRPETAGNLLVIEASAKLTAEDYENVFIPKLNQLIRQFQKIRVVLYLNESFEGWEPNAMWDDAKFGLKHKDDFERIAIVGGPKWVAWISKLSAHLAAVALKTYDTGHLAEAIAWIKH